MSKETHWQMTMLLVMTFMYAGCFRNTKKTSSKQTFAKLTTVTITARPTRQNIKMSKYQ